MVDRYKNIVQKRIDEWIYMLKNNEVNETFTSKNINQAKEKLAEMNMGKQERIQYEKYLFNLARDKKAINDEREASFKKGRMEGEAKGKAEGRAEGKADALLLILTQRFHTIPQNIQDTIQAADLPQLDRWFKRVFDASTLESIFIDQSP